MTAVFAAQCQEGLEAFALLQVTIDGCRSRIRGAVENKAREAATNELHINVVNALDQLFGLHMDLAPGTFVSARSASSKVRSDRIL